MKDKAEIVDDLRKKLADAEKDLEDAKINLGDIIEEEKKMPAIIDKIENRLESLLDGLDMCKAEVAKVQQEIDDTQTSEITIEID